MGISCRRSSSWRAPAVRWWSSPRYPSTLAHMSPGRSSGTCLTTALHVS